MDIRAMIFKSILSTLLLFSSVLAETEPSNTEGNVQYYLYEDDPGPLFWEAEKQTDLGNLKEARELFLQSCEAGVGGSCAALASMFSNGEGGDVDAQQTCHYFQKSCDLGFAQACRFTANALQYDQCGPPDLTQARALYTIACGVDDMQACVHLGKFFEGGVGGVVDLAEARRLFSKACTGESLAGCNDYAGMLWSGRGGEVDVNAARALLKQGCAKEFYISCYQLAKRVEPTDGQSDDVFKLYQKSRTAFQKICANYRKNEDLDSCYRYFYMVAYGEGGPAQPERVINVLELACAENHQPSCDTFAELNSKYKLQ